MTVKGLFVFLIQLVIVMVELGIAVRIMSLLTSANATNLLGINRTPVELEVVSVVLMDNVAASSFDGCSSCGSDKCGEGCECELHGRKDLKRFTLNGEECLRRFGLVVVWRVVE